MSLQTKVDVIGLDELLEVLKDLPAELVSQGRGAKNPVFKALDAAAEPVLKSMQNLAPYDSGRLRGAIKKQRHPKPRILNEIVGVGVDPGRSRDDQSGAWYGYIVEARTGFMRRAADKNREKVVNIFSNELASRLEKIAKKVGNENARKVAAQVRAQTTVRTGSGFFKNFKFK